MLTQLQTTTTYPVINTTRLVLMGKRKQSGVVLFIAMVALVVMSLASVALIRSVDTNSIIAGNLSFNQSAQLSSSFGIESAANQLFAEAPVYAQTDHPNEGYYASCKDTFNPSVEDLRCMGNNLMSDISWVPGTTSRLAVDPGIAGVIAPLIGGVDAYGNRIQYIIERMCAVAGELDSDNCLVALGSKEESTRKTSGLVAPTIQDANPLPLYRVTVRIDGPKNTLTFIQAFIS